MPGGRSGGAAMALGAEYQGRVAAWLATRALVANAAPVLWNWPQDTVIRRIFLETSDAVDDIRVETDRDDRAFIQVKHRVDAGRSDSTPLRKALDQFVRQAPTANENDRFVIATTSESSQSLTRDLPRVLERIRREQAIDEAACCRNARERSIHATIVMHLSASWEQAGHREPGDDDLFPILRKLYVTTVDVDQDQAAAIESEGHLRGVLAEPAQARAAWLDVVASASEAAILQTGITQAWLAERLSDHGFSLGVLTDYRRDVRQLRSITRAALTRLSQSRSLLGGDSRELHIAREIAPSLVAAAEESLLITGEPGSGKSGALAELIAVLSARADVVFLSADTVVASTANELRSEFGLEHPFAEVLSGWYSDQPGYLVIDALDAGRGSRTQDALSDLMRDVLQQKGRFRVIASIRTFDLCANAPLGELFSGRPASLDPRHQLPELSRVRHFVVPRLSDLEVAQVRKRAPKLETALQSAPAALRELLGNAFCLRLFAQLVEEEGLPEHPISTALELLDAYWVWRVRKTGLVATRNELALRALCDLMIASGTLTVDRLGAGVAGHVEAIADLLRNGVLIEVAGPGGPGVAIGFAHHILFDYAVSRVLVRHSAGIAELLAADDARTLLVARPSFQMHFEYLWTASADHRAFWDQAVDVARADVPEIARTIAPAVAARLVRVDSDWSALFARLDSERDGAALVLRHLIGAHLADEPESGITLPRAQAWAAICADLALRIDHDLASLVRALLLEATTGPWMADPAIAASIGSAARALMSWCEANGREDRYFLQVAIPAVINAFDAAPAENERLLRDLIESDRLARSGYIEAPMLAGGIVRLARTAPTLVRDVYAAIFEHEETSREPTTMSRGVLGLTSNRKQDYESAHYSLTQGYPDFIAAAPRDAISALSKILRAYSKRRGGTDETFELEWEGEIVRLVDSHRFWAMDRERDDESQMLGAFETWFDEQLEATREAAAEDPFDEVLSIIRKLEAPAALWRIVLKAGSSNPVRLNQLLPLFTTRSSLMSNGLSQPLGEAIRLGFADLPSASRAEIESSIWALGATAAAGGEVDNRARDRLLACIPVDAAVTPRTLAHLMTLLASDSVPANPLPGVVVVEDSDDDWWLRDNGVDKTDATNALVLAMVKPLRAFVDDDHGSTVELDVAREAWDGTLKLDAFLAECGSSVAPRLVEWARSDIGRTLELICKSDLPARLDSSTMDRFVNLVVSIATEPDETSTSDLEAFDETPSWSASGRVGCAEAMMRLLRMGIRREVLLGPVRSLARSTSVDVRFAIARMLHAISANEEALAWELIDLLEGDPSGAVRTTVINLEARLLIDDRRALLDRLSAAYAQAASLGGRGKNPRKACIAISSWLWMWRGENPAGRFVLDCLVRSDDATVGEAIQSELRSALEATGVDGREVRQRGVALILAVVDHVKEQIHRGTGSAVSAAETDTAQKLWHVIDGVASDVYFASGAYGRSEGDPRRSPEQPFYEDTRELIQRLSTMPHPSIIHHNLQTLDYLSPVAPSAVFVDIAEVLSRGRAGGYEYDRIGASFMVAVVQRFLTQHRSIFQSNSELRRALVEVLDTLVTAGWPDATRLTYQLESIYR